MQPFILTSVAILHAFHQIKSGHLDSKRSSATIMLSDLMCSIIACFSCALLAKAVQNVNDQLPKSDPNDLHLPSHPLSILSISNATSSLVNASTSNDMSVKCDGNKYGFKPDVNDCTSVLRRQLVGRVQMKFGPRGSIIPENFVSLPYRLMGGT